MFTDNGRTSYDERLRSNRVENTLELASSSYLLSTILDDKKRLRTLARKQKI